jgi:hypothetical protein
MSGSANDVLSLHKKLAMGQTMDAGQTGPRSLPAARCDCDPKERGYGRTIDPYEGTGSRASASRPEGGKFSRY